MKLKTVAVIVGTRPEAVKLAPVIKQLREAPDFKSIICDTGQHKDLCGQTLAYFDLQADVILPNVMVAGQSLSELNSKLLRALGQWLETVKVDGVIVQGDTMSAFCGALAAFYQKTPVFHVEAGLRSHNLHEPFPEEALRQMIARITSLNFAPTELARAHLEAENTSCCQVTGNTGIDALSKLGEDALKKAESSLATILDLARPIVLITAHRRENHGERLSSIIQAIKKLATRFAAAQFLLPMHPNQAVRQAFSHELAGYDNIILTEPLPYATLVYVMRQSVLIMTDSGGIQEEAPSFGVPILVLREKTERPEGIEAGVARLVGANEGKIFSAAAQALTGQLARVKCGNPYGDGKAAKRIVELIRKYFEQKEEGAFQG